MEAKRAALSEEQARATALAIERERLAVALERDATARREAAVSAIENWWDKYRVSLRDIESEREAAAEKLNGFARELGYAK